MVLKITNVIATPTAVAVFFSESLDPSTVATGAFSVSCPLTTPQMVASVSYDSFDKRVTLAFPAGTVLKRGQWISVKASGIKDLRTPPNTISDGGNDTFVTRVNGDDQDLKNVKEVTEAVEDAVAYPLLTEPVSFTGSGGGSTAPGGFSAGGSGSLGQAAAKAISDVLSWKATSADPKGFVGALTQSFTLTEFEGHVESKWTPRSYAVQTDLSGGITGAQASLYSRAKDALDRTLPLLDGLYPLDPEADSEDVAALREMARNQMSEIVRGLGEVGGPPVLRINTYFEILLGYGPVDFSNPAPPVFDPDTIAGTLGSLRDTYGISFKGNPFSNSIEDEQNITNFRIISDYMTSLLQSWLSNGQFFVLGGSTEAFFGTQLVLLSRQFSVISDSVEEVRFALESVFIPKSEQQTVLLEFADKSLPAMFLHDMLSQVADLSRNEGPRLLQQGGRFSVNNNILPVARSLRHLVREARKPTNLSSLPDGYKTVRVQRALDDLHDQLRELVNLAKPVGRNLPGQEPSPAALQQAVSSAQTPGLVAIPSEIDFGSVTATQGGTPATVNLVNLSNQIPFSKVDVTIGGGDSGDFRASPTSFPGLGALQTCGIQVTFSPATPSNKPRTSSLVVIAGYKDAQGNPQIQTASVSLKGMYP